MNRAVSSIQNDPANPVSTPAADQPATINGYTQRTLTRSTRNPVQKIPIANATEKMLSSWLYCALVSENAALISFDIWFSAMRSI